jgi:hypothetical protein
MNKNAWLIVIVVIVVLLLGWSWLARSEQPTPEPVTVADPMTLPGMRATEAPWPLDIADLKGRLAADGIPTLSEEGDLLHTHQHLDIFIAGQAVPVPANIGIGPGFIAPIHTHDERGVIHVESPFAAAFTLGQFFDIWGVRLTAECVGGYCATSTSTLRVYVNGSLHEGDPRLIELAPRQQIAVVYGTPEEGPSEIPATYGFSPNE